MKTFLAKLGFGENLRSNLFVIIVLAFGGQVIYGLPYFRFDYYDVYIEMYNLTNTQMGQLGSIFGLFGMVSYLFGGYVADKISVRKIASYSLIITGVMGFVHLLPLPFAALCVLYAVWGFSTLFAFWPGCIKAVRLMAEETDQGKAFGWFEGWRSISAMITAPLAVVAFRIGVSFLDDSTGMFAVIIFYSVLTLVIGIICHIKIKDKVVGGDNKVKLKDIGKVIKLPAVWLMSGITFCVYVFVMGQYYFTPYSTSFFGLSVTFAAIIAATKRWSLPISTFGAGYLIDKIGAENLFLASFGISALCVGGIILLPQTPSSAIWYLILFLVNYIAYNVVYSLSWSLLEKGGVPQELSGTSAGIISTLGYLPETFVALLAGVLIDGNAGSAMGYAYFFSFLAGAMVLGAIFVILWKMFIRKTEKSEK